MRKNTLITWIILIILCSISFFMKPSTRNMMKSTETVVTKDKLISIDIPKKGIKSEENGNEYDIDYTYLNKESLLNMRIICIDDFQEDMRVEDIELVMTNDIELKNDIEVKQHNETIDNVYCSIIEYELTYEQIESDMGKSDDRIKYIHIISSVNETKTDIVIMVDEDYYINNEEEIQKIIESIKFTGVDSRHREGSQYYMDSIILDEKLSKNKLLSIKVPQNCIEDSEDENTDLCYYNTEMVIEYTAYELDGHTLDEVVEAFRSMFKEEGIVPIEGNRVLDGIECKTITIEGENYYGEKMESIYILAVIDDIEHEIIISKNKHSINMLMDNREDIINSITFN